MLIEAENLVKAGSRTAGDHRKGIPAPMASTSNTPKASGAPGPVRRSSSILPASLASCAWIRLHYVYPYPHVDDVIELMAAAGGAAYLDIPFQHAQPQRPQNHAPPGARKGAGADQVVAQACPTSPSAPTFIVGFPGETEDDFNFMLDWLDEAELDRVGCFKYEPVAGAKANEIAEAVDGTTKRDHWDRFMEHQRLISERRMAKKVGRTIEVLIDEGRRGRRHRPLHADAPEIDSNVFLEGEARGSRATSSGEGRSGGKTTISGRPRSVIPLHEISWRARPCLRPPGRRTGPNRRAVGAWR